MKEGNLTHRRAAPMLMGAAVSFEDRRLRCVVEPTRWLDGLLLNRIV